MIVLLILNNKEDSNTDKGARVGTRFYVDFTDAEGFIIL